MMRWLFPERGISAALIAQAGIQPGESILDIGCGTGTLALLIKKTNPDAALYGLDIDPKVLEIARQKSDNSNETILFQRGLATCLPYADETFDRVFSSLLLHHLTREDKQQALKEIFRVLRSGGELHIADFGQPRDFTMRLISWLTRWFEEVYDNVLGLIPDFAANAGFNPVQETAYYRTIFGAVVLIRACKPER